MMDYYLILGNFFMIFAQIYFNKRRIYIIYNEYNIIKEHKQTQKCKKKRIAELNKVF